MALNKFVVNLVGYGGSALVYLAFYLSHLRAGENEATALNPFYLMFLCVLYVTHFLKRVLECIFVHIWSDDTVPSFEGLGEWIYYLGFSAWIAHSVHNGQR